MGGRLPGASNSSVYGFLVLFHAESEAFGRGKRSGCHLLFTCSPYFLTPFPPQTMVLSVDTDNTSAARLNVGGWEMDGRSLEVRRSEECKKKLCET